MEVVVEIVGSMVSVGELELWSDDMGIFGKALWWLQECWFENGVRFEWEMACVYK